MKHLDEYRDPHLFDVLMDQIHKKVTRSWTLMEICGGQTHSLVKNGIVDLLPKNIRLVHGPGCPVCVTSLGVIDEAIKLASRPDVILCSYGDMLRVPGSSQSLLEVKALGADVRILYSPLEAVQLAKSNPDKEVVFFAVRWLRMFWYLLPWKPSFLTLKIPLTASWLPVMFAPSWDSMNIIPLQKNTNARL